jgi:hypothetical protein
VCSVVSGARPGVSGIWGRGLFDCGYRGVQLFLGTKESESRIRIRIQNPNPNPKLESGNRNPGPLMPNKGVYFETVLTRHGMTFFQAIWCCCDTFRNRSTSVSYSSPFWLRETAEVRNYTVFEGFSVQLTIASLSHIFSHTNLNRDLYPTTRIIKK